MSVNIKQLDGSLQKVAGNTIILDASCAEVRSGSFSTELISADGYATVNVVFSTPMPDANYVAILNPRSGAWIKANYMVSDKTTTGFTALCSNTYAAGGMPTQIVDYYAFQLIELTGYTALQNKVNNPDSAPTENSTNLVTSGGVYDAIKNASSIFVGTAAEWAAETDKTDFNVALITDAGTVNAVDDTTGDTEVVANKNVVFKGTLAEWEALTTAEKKTYDEALITNDMDTGEVVNGVTDGDMRAVTSNAVYDYVNTVNTGTVSFTKNPTGMTRTLNRCIKIAPKMYFIQYTITIDSTYSKVDYGLGQTPGGAITINGKNPMGVLCGKLYVRAYKDATTYNTITMPCTYYPDLGWIFFGRQGQYGEYGTDKMVTADNWTSVMSGVVFVDE